MQDISAFFADKVALLNEGRIDEACDSVLLPTTFYLGEEIMFVSDKPSLVTFTTTYMNKLRDAGLTVMSFETRSLSPLRNGGMKADLTWHCDSETGLARQSMDITYYCRLQGGEWRIALVEITTPPSDAFLSARDRDPA